MTMFKHLRRSAWWLGSPAYPVLHNGQLVGVLVGMSFHATLWTDGRVFLPIPERFHAVFNGDRSCFGPGLNRSIELRLIPGPDTLHIVTGEPSDLEERDDYLAIDSDLVPEPWAVLTAMQTENEAAAFRIVAKLEAQLESLGLIPPPVQN